MEELLLALLNSLEAVGQHHDKISDTESREAMRRAVFQGFLKPDLSFSLPMEFGLEDDEANLAIGDALRRYIQAANRKAGELGLDFHGRLRAFQNPSVQTPSGTTYDGQEKVSGTVTKWTEAAP